MINLIIKNSKKEKANLITFLNPYSYLLARREQKLFEQFHIKFDGLLLVKILNLLGLRDTKRESFDMTSLAPLVFNQAIKENKSIYFIGAKPKVIDKTIENIKNEFKDLNIIGYRDGYMNKNEKNEVLNELKQLNPDLIICGMGTPLQEQFLVDLQGIGWKGVGYTCGGFLHQTSQDIKYYPDWINKYHLRSLYRVYDEPQLFKRYFLEYPKFLIYFSWDFISIKKIKIIMSPKKRTNKKTF